MGINIDQLEINVNLHALQPGFLNSELHYIIAESADCFRFTTWDEEPGVNEEKFYCFLTNQELHVAAGNILLKQSYVLKEDPIYPVITAYTDFIDIIETLLTGAAAKGIRRFYNEDIEGIKERLEEKYVTIEKHVVTSTQGKHLLFLLNDIEISVSATMIYFRYKTSFNKSHYSNIKEEGELK